MKLLKVCKTSHGEGVSNNVGPIAKLKSLLRKGVYHKAVAVCTASHGEAVGEETGFHRGGELVIT